MELQPTSTGNDPQRTTAAYPWPKARQDEGIVAQQVLDEYVVYNLRTDQVHSLNTTAAQVWGWCDGQTPPEEMACRLVADSGLSGEQGKALVELGLRQLQQANLLDEPPLASQDGSRLRDARR